jgi:hypothetical protein
VLSGGAEVPAGPEDPDGPGTGTTTVVEGGGGAGTGTATGTSAGGFTTVVLRSQALSAATAAIKAATGKRFLIFSALPST